MRSAASARPTSSGVQPPRLARCTSSSSFATVPRIVRGPRCAAVSADFGALRRSMPMSMTSATTPASPNSTPATVCITLARDSRSSIAVNLDAGVSRMSEVSSGTSEIRRTEARGSEYDCSRPCVVSPPATLLSMRYEISSGGIETSLPNASSAMSRRR